MKYQRITTFMLRLLRGLHCILSPLSLKTDALPVHHVCQAIFLMSRSSPVFPTFTPQNTLLSHARFACQSFMTSLMSYIFDSTIRRHFEPFLADVLEHTRRDPTDTGSRKPHFRDVFALAAHHGEVLDRILSDCLLRSSQKHAGGLIQACLETILELGIMACRLRNEELEEYQAVPHLERLQARFDRKRGELVSK